jgi:dihydrofolate reductase
MAQLIYFAMTSLDGYIEDEDGTFDWAAPSDEVHAAANDLARAAGTMLYGRRMYETMAVWETDPSLTSRPGVVADFARIWQTADKIVYSTTLSAASTRRTAIEPNFEVDTVRGLKASAARDLMIGGANIAAEAFRAGLIDRCDLSRPLSSAAASRPCPTASAWTSSCSTTGDSPTAPSTSNTA